MIYSWRLDVLKAFAIFAVILLHSLNKKILIEYDLQFSIWQAMPVFMLLIGYNFTFSLRKSHNFWNFIKKRLKRILLTLVIFNLIYYLCFYPKNLNELIYLIFLIPYPNYGTYFIGMLLSVVFIFPLFFYFIKYLYDRNGLSKTILILFFLGVLIDILSFNLIDNKFLYSIFPSRYFFDISLGVLLTFKGYKILQNPIIIMGTFFNIIWLLSYKEIIKYFSFIPDEWIIIWKFQHIFYFYTLILVIFFIYKLPKIFNNKILINIGQASLNIFLFQSVFFTFLKKYVKRFVYIEYKIYIYILICILIGMLWFMIEKKTINIFKKERI